MVKLFFIIFSFVFSSLSFASFNFPNLNWDTLSDLEKSLVLGEMKSVIKDHPSHKAGWLDRPEKNSDYHNHIGCIEGQTLCNPSFFGEAICISNQSTKSCEEEFIKRGLSNLEILDQIDASEIKKNYNYLEKKCPKANPVLCQKFKNRLQHILPDEVPETLSEVKKALEKNEVIELIKTGENLKQEFLTNVAEFEGVCEAKVSPENGRYCKNLAMKIKTADVYLQKISQNLESVNCDDTDLKVMNPDALPALSVDAKGMCSEKEKSLNEQTCGKEVACVIASTVASNFVTISELLEQKPGQCMNSQNDCFMNFISSLIKSLVSLVTGIWDLLGVAVEWSGEKLAQFWSNVTSVEDKTSDAQQMINKMSEEDLQAVKKSPVEWLTNASKVIWNGVMEWMRTDVFCEKWEGIPRASKCSQPMLEFSCLSCRTKMTATCSIGGLVAAEVVPFFLTGGIVNIAARGTQGAKEFADFLKISKSYEKIVSKVEDLKNVTALKVGADVIKNARDKLIIGIEKITSSKSYLQTKKILDKAAKYSGLAALNALNTRAFNAGFQAVDNAMGAAPASIKGTEKVQSFARFNSLEGQDKDYYESVSQSYLKGQELEKKKAKYDLLVNSGEKTSTKNQAALLTEITQLENDLTKLNNEFINKLHSLYSEKGIVSKTKKMDDGSLVLELDLTKIPSNQKSFDFYKRVKQRFGVDKITVSLKENVQEGTAAFFMPSDKRLELGPIQGHRLLDDYVSTTGKHESHHAMFFAKRNKGEESIFHIKFYASKDGKQLLNPYDMYPNYMSAEELYTTSSEMQSFAKILDSRMSDHLLNQINVRANDLSKIAKASEDLSDAMINSLEKMISGEKQMLANLEKVKKINPPSSTDKFNAELMFFDEYGRGSQVTFVSQRELEILEKTKLHDSKISAAFEDYVRSSLKKNGADPSKLLKETGAQGLSDDEKKQLKALYLDFINKDPVGMKLVDEANDLSLNILRDAKQKLEKLKVVSEHQRKEAIKLQSLIEIVRHKNPPDPKQLEILKEQLWSISKNVREDYKGSVLNRPR